jgi:hypothetical protein
MVKVVAWMNTYSDTALANVCAAEAHQMKFPSTANANSWEPASKSIRDILCYPGYFCHHTYKRWEARNKVIHGLMKVEAAQKLRERVLQ